MDKLKEGFTQIKKESLTDRIHDSILEMIIKNPSEEEQVLNEKRLMELFGVSKAPVREALIKLCSEGVLRSVPRFGYMVIRMNEQDIRDALRMRVLLETEALETAFPNLEERELAEIRDHVSKAASKQNVDVWEVWEAGVLPASGVCDADTVPQAARPRSSPTDKTAATAFFSKANRLFMMDTLL